MKPFLSLPSPLLPPTTEDSTWQARDQRYKLPFIIWSFNLHFADFSAQHSNHCAACQTLPKLFSRAAFETSPVGSHKRDIYRRYMATARGVRLGKIAVVQQDGVSMGFILQLGFQWGWSFSCTTLLPFIPMTITCKVQRLSFKSSALTTQQLGAKDEKALHHLAGNAYICKGLHVQAYVESRIHIHLTDLTK